MRSYNYTDKLLLTLGIGNLWMFIPSFFGIWWGFSLIFAGQGDKSQIFTTILLSTIKWLAILLFTTWAFFKRWRWVVLFYVLYLSYSIPIYISALSEYWKQNINLNYFGSAIYGYTYVFLWLLGLITFLIMLIETDYSGLMNRWRKWEAK